MRHSRPPEDGNHMAKHVGVEKIWNVLIKTHYFLERLLVFLQTEQQQCWDRLGYAKFQQNRTIDA
jgi:hypothetical protein